MQDTQSKWEFGSSSLLFMAANNEEDFLLIA